MERLLPIHVVFRSPNVDYRGTNSITCSVTDNPEPNNRHRVWI